MKFVIVGTGGVGGYFGGRLARSGEDVWFVARGSHLSAMRNCGLTVQASDETFLVPPGRMTDDLNIVETADVILFCVKSYDTESVAGMLAPVLSGKSIIISLQNGIDNGEKIRRHIPRGTVYEGAAYIYATITAPGVVTRLGEHKRIVFGPVHPKDDRGGSILAVMHNAGIRADLTSDIQAALWTKFIFISAVGGITAMTRLTLGEILAVTETRQMLEDAMKETEAIARALNVNVPDNIIDRMFENVKSMATNTYSSMYHDLVNAKPLEVEAFAGTLTRYGQRLGVPTPTHKTIYAALLPYHLKHLSKRQ
jgi:2-dehydropantoate 2-reductase